MRLNVLSCLVLPAILAAQPGPQPQLSTMQGKVVDTLSERPLAGAVIVYSGDPTRGRRPAAATESRGVVSGAGGEFLIRDMKPGLYTLWASKLGYVQPRRTGAWRPRVLVRSGQPVRGIVLRLERSAAIAGRVTSENGEPLSRVQVQAWHPETVDGRRELQSSRALTTNDLGEYRLYYLPPGDYYVRAAYYPPLARGVIIEGFRTYPTRFYPGAEDSAHATLISLHPGEERSGIDFRLPSVPAFRVTGRVVGAPSGSPGVSAALTPITNEMFTSTPVGDYSLGLTPTGEFAFAGVAPGEYALTAKTMPEDHQLVALRQITVKDSDVTGIELRLHPPATVLFHVSVEGDDPAAVDLRDAQVSLTSKTGGPSGSVRLDEDQPPAIRNLPPGEYRLQVTLLPQDAYLKSARQGERNVLAGDVFIGETAEPVELLISPHAATISGTVEGNCWNPRCALLVISGDLGDGLFRRLLASQDGRFELRGLAPGTYRVLAFVAGEDQDDDALLGAHEGEFTTIEVTEGERRTVGLKPVQQAGH